MTAQEIKDSAWECNECGSKEYSLAVSEEEVNQFGCSNCGGLEWHKVQPQTTQGYRMKTTYTTDSGDLVIEFDYQPAEKKTATYPGCRETAHVYSVMAGNIDILEWCSGPAILFFEEKCLEQVALDRECNMVAEP
jgi:hypothetical protein